MQTDVSKKTLRAFGYKWSSQAECDLNRTGFVLYLTGLVIYRTGVVLKITGFDDNDDYYDESNGMALWQSGLSLVP